MRHSKQVSTRTATDSGDEQMRRIIPAFQFLVLALEDDAPALLRRALRWI